MKASSRGGKSFNQSAHTGSLHLAVKANTFNCSISRCAFLNAPAGSFPKTIDQLNRFAWWSRERGTVKWFNGQKGFGFIQPDDGGNDVFVHISAVERAGFSNLAEGQKISYEVKVDPRRGKSSAENLRV